MTHLSINSNIALLHSTFKPQIYSSNRWALSNIMSYNSATRILSNSSIIKSDPSPNVTSSEIVIILNWFYNTISAKIYGLRNSLLIIFTCRATPWPLVLTTGAFWLLAVSTPLSLMFLAKYICTIRSVKQLRRKTRSSSQDTHIVSHTQETSCTWLEVEASMEFLMAVSGIALVRINGRRSLNLIRNGVLCPQ